MPSIVFNTNRNNLDIIAKGKYLPTIKEFLFMGITFGLTVFAWIFFRAENVQHAFAYISQICSATIFNKPEKAAFASSQNNSVIITLLIFFFIAVEWFGRERQFAIAAIGIKWPRVLRWGFYSFLIFLMRIFPFLMFK